VRHGAAHWHVHLVNPAHIGGKFEVLLENPNTPGRALPEICHRKKSAKNMKASENPNSKYEQETVPEKLKKLAFGLVPVATVTVTVTAENSRQRRPGSAAN
jgi:hypothetical protein